VILAAARANTPYPINERCHRPERGDPVRVFQEFATLDLLSNGRAEIVAGRGSFIEAFPLFGLDLADYDSLFAEKLELLLKIRENTQVHWSASIALRSPGREFTRAHSRTRCRSGSASAHARSFIRAGTLGLPLMWRSSRRTASFSTTDRPLPLDRSAGRSFSRPSSRWASTR